MTPSRTDRIRADQHVSATTDTPIHPRDRDGSPACPCNRREVTGYEVLQFGGASRAASRSMPGNRKGSERLRPPRLPVQRDPPADVNNLSFRQAISRPRADEPDTRRSGGTSPASANAPKAVASDSS